VKAVEHLPSHYDVLVSKSLSAKSTQKLAQ
jgi:hypothetical protein